MCICVLIHRNRVCVYNKLSNCSRAYIYCTLHLYIIIIIKQILLCPLPVSLCSPSDATFTQTFPEEKEEGAAFGEETEHAALA